MPRMKAFMTLTPTRRAASLVALALSLSLPAMAQESTGDPFLDAMMSDQGIQPTPPSAPKSETKTPSVPIAPAAPSAEKAEPQPAKPVTRYVSAADETLLLDDSVVARELGPQTGIFVAEKDYEGKRVTRVDINYTNKRTVPDARLYDIIQTRAGSEYSSMRINSDLERLIERGLVHPDTRVSVAPHGQGVSVTFVVKSASVMGGVGFTGNTRFTERDLREGLNDETKTGAPGGSALGSGRVLNDRELSQAQATIIKMYHEAGYPDVKVSWRNVATERSSHNDVIFDIVEGREVSMNNIEFVGNREFDATQLRQIMKTKERGLFTWITKSGRIDREQVEDDLQAIVRQYRNYGYLRARIANVEYFSSPNTEGRQRLTMRVTIEEGPRYRVRNVSFGGIKVYQPAELEPGLSMLGGDIYSLKKVSDDTQMIRKYYGAKGYADAEVRPDINEVGVDEKGMRLIDIRYDVNEGNRYAVGRINVRGNSKTKPHVILRELPLKPGSNLNSVDLETAKKRLENLNYFSSVSVSQASSSTPGYRDINVDVAEKMTGSFTLGVAFSTVENVYLYATVTQSNFDIRGFRDGVFVGGGQRLTVSGKLGTEYQSASVYLLEPWFLDRKLALGNELYYSTASYMSDYYQQENYGYAVSLRKALDDKNSVKLEYRIEAYTFDPEWDAPPFFEEACDRDYTRSNIRLSYEYDTRDAVITPRKGGNFEAFASYSGPGSTVQTYSTGVSGSWFHNSAWDSIFSIHYAAETVDTFSNDKDVPIFERCYLGGQGDLRGFRYRDVGMVDPVLAGDETMGGKSSAYVQFEVTVPVIESIRFATFVDVGFVHEDSFDFDPSDFAADYGIGLRINLPMGPLAVDYAIPFKTDNAIDRNGQFQFYVDYKY